MSSSSLLFPLSIFCSTLLLQISLGDNLLGYSCGNYSDPFPPVGTYANNMYKLIHDLPLTIIQTRFKYISVGNSSNKVYGLAQCRPDTNQIDCETCLTTASAEIRYNCLGNKTAYGIFEHCLLGYSGYNFSGQVVLAHKLLTNTAIANNILNFKSTVKELLTAMAKEAYVNPQLYAPYNMTINGENATTLYGYAQCTRDLTPKQCMSCLDVANAAMFNISGNLGAAWYSWSCEVRYEIYSFFKA